MANYHKMKYQWATAVTVEQARKMIDEGADENLVVWIQPDGTIKTEIGGMGFFLGAIAGWNKV